MRTFTFNGNKAELSNFKSTVAFLKSGCFITKGYVEWPVLNEKFDCMVLAKQSTVTELLLTGFVIADCDRLVINPEHLETEINYKSEK